MSHETTATQRVAERIARSLERHADALRDGPLLLAISGGADSLAMLLAFAALPPSRRPALIAAHFAHGLRPEADPIEGDLVERVAAQVGVPVVRGHGRVPPSEAAAREARYAFLAEAARAHGARAIATAHTQDDQAETLLLRLARGTGTRGAGAIRELSTRTVDGSPVQLFRPLLHVSRADTEAVCQEAGVVPAMDATNQSLRYARNRIRLRVLPELERINPAVRRVLSTYAETAREDDALLERLAMEAVDGRESWEANGVRWPRETLAGLPGPLQSRVLQRAWRRMAGEEAALSSAKLLAARRLVSRPGGGSLSLGGSLRLVVEQDACRLERVAATPRPLEQPLPAEGVITFGQWVITVRRAAPPVDVKGGPWNAVLDADRVGDLCVRARRPGDRFHPLGMPDPKRLQDVFVNARVPRTERETWPVVTGAEGIAWVPGVRIAEWAKVTDRTRRVVLLTAERKSDA